MPFKFIVTLLIGLFALNATASSGTNFSPDGATRVAVHINGGHILYEIENESQKKREEINFEVEKQLHIEIADYNFDGRLDFSVWHTDEGMGTYTLHRVFVFSKEKNEFIENFPKCNDEFINLKVDKKNKRLISTYFEGGIPRLCKTNLKKSSA
ncbi:hypothetical protein PO002_38655 [Cupriavidus necator]|uniref:XAC2610-related protein n=1 Tax=Cupriavidus necator TaxID=106590 RepID=UPI0039C45C3E